VRVLSATVSEQAGHWFVSVQVQQDHAVVPLHNAPTNSGPVVGVDLGRTTRATGSDGTVFANPRHLQRRLMTIKRQHRVVSRRHQGSQHRKKAVRTLGRRSRREAHQRADTLERMSDEVLRASLLEMRRHFLDGWPGLEGGGN